MILKNANARVKARDGALLTKCAKGQPGVLENRTVHQKDYQVHQMIAKCAIEVYDLMYEVKTQ